MVKVITFGTFDPLHEGHINLFKQAKKLGDTLIVVTATDENIKKNKHRNPRLKQKVRIEKIKRTGIPDKVVSGDRDESYGILEKINPGVIALGYDQKIPTPLKERIKKYKIVTLKSFRPEIYKSSKVYKK